MKLIVYLIYFVWLSRWRKRVSATHTHTRCMHIALTMCSIKRKICVYKEFFAVDAMNGARADSNGNTYKIKWTAIGSARWSLEIYITIHTFQLYNKLENEFSTV